PRVAEVAELVLEIADRPTRRDAGGEDVGVLLDLERGDQAALRRADDVHLLRPAVLRGEDLDEVEDVRLTLHDRETRLAVAVRGEREPEAGDEIRQAEVVLAELVLRDRDGCPRILETVRPDDEHPVVA